MVTTNTSLTFEIEQQSLWRPGRAEELRIDSGNFMIWDPAEITKEFSVEVLGFGLSAEAYLDVRFGLLAYADLGTGGDWGASYDIDVTVDYPAAVFAGDDITFDFSSARVVASALETLGFGNSRISGSGNIGAGLDLIIDIKAGMRDVIFEHWFGTEGPASFSLINLDESIQIIGVDLEDPEYTINFSDEVSLTARLPTGANIEASGAAGLIEGSGASDTRFLELNADVDALLIKLLSKMPPPVAAVAKVLGDTVFAEHTFDISDYVSFIGEGKFFFDFTLLDIGAGAGLVVTEDASLDITRTNSDDLDISVTITSDNGTPDDASDDTLSVTGYLGEDLTIAAPTTGFGTANFTAEYQVNRGSFFHGLGVGLNASITVDALQGALGGSWVPSALQFSFGPLLEVEFPDGGLTIDLGNIYEDTFEIDASEFNTEEDVYEVFYVEEDLAPTNWNPNNPDAVAQVYKNFQIYFENLEASQNDPNYAGLGYNMQPGSTPGSSFDFSGQQNILFTWTGSINQTVTLGQNNGSLGKVDTRATSQDNLHVRLDNGSFVGNTAGSASAQFGLLTSLINGASTITYQSDGNTVTFDTSADVYGGDFFDLMVLFGDDTRFIDGGGEIDQLVADFSQLIGNEVVQWDLLESYNAEQDNDSSTVGGITLFEGTDSELVIKNIEGVTLKTGDGDDYFHTFAYQDALLTSGGNDFVDNHVDRYDDFIALGDGDDTVFAGFFSNTTIDTTDRLLGGLGDDKAFIQLGNEGLRYNYADYSIQFPSQITDRFGSFGLDNTAGLDEYENFLLKYYLIRQFLTGPAANTSEASEVFSENQWQHITLNNGASFSNIKIAFDMERISISASEGGGQGDDLVIYMGGSEYTAGAGSDTFVADFAQEEYYFGARGGAVIKLNDTAIDGYFGETVIDGFERLAVKGTTGSDEFFGGQLEDGLDGGAGNDVLYGGDDDTADLIYGGTGSDRILWSNDGADLIEGWGETFFGGYDEAGFEANFGLTASRDILDVVGSDSDDHGLYYRFATGFTQSSTATSSITYNTISYDGYDYWYAFDPIEYLKKVLEWSTDANSENLDYTNLGLDTDAGGAEVYMGFRDIEVVNLDLSDTHSDLMVYQGGTRYIGGESANDIDTFVADLSHMGAPMDIQIKDDEAADGSDGYFIANQIYVQGLDRLILNAGTGSDILAGGKHDDYIDGGDGDDQIMATAGNDVLIGGLGRDLIMWGAEGNTTARGGPSFGDYGELDHLMVGGGLGDAGSTFSIVNDNNGLLGEVLSASSSTDALSDALNFFYNAPSAPGSDTTNDQSVNSFIYDAGTYQIDYRDFHSVDMAGADGHDDIIVYQTGVAYYGGEHANDADLFVGDFTFDASNGFEGRIDYGDLLFVADTGDGAITDSGNGIKTAGFERFHLRLSDGNDTVIGGDYDDLVWGGDGNDYFEGGLGDDVFWGGGGNDTFVHQGGNDFLYTQGGYNVVSLDTEGRGNLQFGVTYDQNDVDGSEITQYWNSATTLLTYSDFERLVYALDFDNMYASSQLKGALHYEYGGNSLEFGGSSETNIQGSSLNDVMVGLGLQDTLIAGGGDDVLFARGQNNFLMGGSGSDTYVFDQYFGNNVIFDETGSATTLLFLDNLVDDLYFEADGTDLVIQLLRGSALDSIRVVGYFNDDVNGRNFSFEDSTGNRKLDLTYLNAQINVTGQEFNEIEGSDENDTLAYASHLTDLMVLGEGDDFVLSSLGEDLINGGAGDDGVSYANSHEGVDVRLSGGETASGGTAEGDLLVSIEHVAGSNMDDILSGSALANTLNGGGGNDEVYGGDGDDILSGAEGKDELYGGEGNDTLYGDIGNDLLEGSYRNDSLFGGNGRDILRGGSHSDLLNDGFGNDKTYGGTGNDYILYEGGFDYWNGGGGSDWGDFGGIAKTITVDLSGDEIVRRTTSTGEIKDIVQLEGVENIRGSLANDVLIGSNGDNHLNGNLGDDLLVGKAGDDTLIGESGFDTVDYSQDGGTKGIDLQLGSDFNLFGEEYLTGTDSHRDTDNLLGIEKIIGTKYADNIQTTNENSVIFGGRGTDFISGMAGNDLLMGENGNDNVRGGDGDDILSGGAGNDDVRGGDGSDLVLAGLDTGIGTYFGGDYVLGDDGNTDDFDTLSFADTTENLVVFIPSNFAFKGTGNEDTFYNFEHYIMGQGNDRFTGGDLGFNDNDTVSYVGGLDSYDGGDGHDTVSYSSFDHAVEVNLLNFLARTMDKTDVVNGTFREITSIVNFEDVVGSAYDDILTGNADANIILGGEGDDVLDGRGGDDVIEGGAGNDNIIMRPDTGADTIDGGAGFDFLEARTFGTGVTLNLTNGDGDDTVVNVEGLIGTVFVDYLTGDSGNNVFRGVAGTDFITAGDGDDLIIVEDGEAYVSGGLGRDTFDFSAFAAGISVDMSESFNYVTHDNTDLTYNNSGTLRSIAGVYDLSVENLIGTAYGDIIKGNTDDNALNGGLGNDVLLGRLGDDNFSYTGGMDTWNGGGGSDTGNFSTFQYAVMADLSATGVNASHASGTNTQGTLIGIVDMLAMENLVGSMFDDVLIGDEDANILSGFFGNDTITANGGNDIVDGGDGEDMIFGGAGNDTLIGGTFETDGADTIIGEAGNDTLRGGAGDDDLDGGAGTDELFGEDGNDELKGGNGTDTLDGGDDDDVLRGGNGGDTLMGQSGNDMLYGDDGFDVLHGGAGNDILEGGLGDDILNGGDSSDILEGGAGADEILGGTGSDTATYASSSEGVSINLAAGTGLGGDAEGDTFDSIERLIGSDHGDTLEGNGANEVFEGGDGADTIRGRGGDDWIYGGDGDDFAFAGGGDDSISGEDGDDTLNGQGGSDQLSGGAGNDTLNAGADDDFVMGGTGNDLIFGGDGEDMLKGEGGADTIVGDAGNDELQGGNGNDTLRGGEDHDLILGGSGNDTIYGDQGLDLLLGEAGDDDLRGGGGNDRLDGGIGDDMLTGGASIDVFVFSGNYGADTVTDYEVGVDKFDLTGALIGFGDYFGTATQNGADVTLDYGDGNSLTVLNATLEQIQADSLNLPF